MSPETTDGWLAQVFYLGGLGLAGVVAWVSRYRRGSESEASDEGSIPRTAVQSLDRSPRQYVVLESAELADMHAVRAILPELRLVTAKLAEIYRVVESNNKIVSENHHIVEQNHEMLTILQRIERDMDVQHQVEARLRQQRADDAGRDRRKQE